MITQVPLDVLFEILGCLQPIDLLTLSWASKTLNDIIMGKTGRYLWEEAFERLDSSNNPPPPYPKDLNLAQYTRFIFGTKCMICETAPAAYDSWEMRIRVCQGCLCNSGSFLPYRCTFPISSNWVLTRIFGANYEIFVKKSEYEYVEARVNALTSLGRDEELLSLKEEWNQTYATKADVGATYRIWKAIRKSQHKDDLKRTRAEREASILRRLEMLGWEESDIRKMNNGKISSLPGFSKSKPLTDREWGGLQEKLLLYLQQLKLAYTEVRRREVLLQYLSTIRERINKLRPSTSGAPLPEAEDLALLDPFRSRIFGECDRTAEVVGGDEELAESIAGWNESRRRFLLSLIPNYILESQCEPLELASVFFSFDGPTPSLAYPHTRAYDHRVIGGQIPNKEPQDLHLLEKSFTRPWNWDCHLFFFNHRHHQISKNIIKAAGGDPLKTTSSAMDHLSLALTFQCLQCSDFTVVGQWRGAVEHEATCHFNALELPIHLKWEINQNY